MRSQLAQMTINHIREIKRGDAQHIVNLAQSIEDDIFYELLDGREKPKVDSLVVGSYSYRVSTLIKVFDKSFDKEYKWLQTLSELLWAYSTEIDSIDRILNMHANIKGVS